MKKRNENPFINKFRFLRSQESSEDISWSCSDSNDDEHINVPSRPLNNITNAIGRKRKRANSRRKEHNNISNLDITISDQRSERNNSVISVKSPILKGRSNSGVRTSPIIPKSLLSNTKMISNSILNNSTLKCNNLNLSSERNPILKSPVIRLKHQSPRVTSKVRKKLFKSNTHGCENNGDSKVSQSNRCTSPILSSRKYVLDKRKCLYASKTPKHDGNNLNDETYKDLHNNNSTDKFTIEVDSIEYSSSQESGPKKELVAKVKSFFDNYFTSEASQISISECETFTSSKSKSSSEIDISTPQTQEINLACLSKASSTNKLEGHRNKRTKKVKYKRDGLSYRLNLLTKKQNSSVNLWQHERFLAANSNFVIPKEDFTAYRIKNVLFKYGIHLLEIVNNVDENFIAIINNLYQNNNSFEVDSILKIYEPFKIIDVNNCKIICNICKFECEKILYK